MANLSPLDVQPDVAMSPDLDQTTNEPSSTVPLASAKEQLIRLLQALPSDQALLAVSQAYTSHSRKCIQYAIDDYDWDEKKAPVVQVSNDLHINQDLHLNEEVYINLRNDALVVIALCAAVPVFDSPAVDEEMHGKHQIYIDTVQEILVDSVARGAPCIEYVRALLLLVMAKSAVGQYNGVHGLIEAARRQARELDLDKQPDYSPAVFEDLRSQGYDINDVMDDLVLLYMNLCQVDWQAAAWGHSEAAVFHEDAVRYPFLSNSITAMGDPTILLFDRDHWFYALARLDKRMAERHDLPPDEALACTLRIQLDLAALKEEVNFGGVFENEDEQEQTRQSFSPFFALSRFRLHRFHYQAGCDDAHLASSHSLCVNSAHAVLLAHSNLILAEESSYTRRRGFKRNLQRAWFFTSDALKCGLLLAQHRLALRNRTRIDWVAEREESMIWMSLYQLKADLHFLIMRSKVVKSLLDGMFQESGSAGTHTSEVLPVQEIQDGATIDYGRGERECDRMARFIPPPTPFLR